ncbi:hypothetical protein J0H58_16550 [bacterium]|nr:hypothetical protein [bacterium]
MHLTCETPRADDPALATIHELLAEGWSIDLAEFADGVQLFAYHSDGRDHTVVGSDVRSVLLQCREAMLGADVSNPSD